jgi:hypothetical protein
MNSCSGVACCSTGLRRSYGTPPVYSRAENKKELLYITVVPSYIICSRMGSLGKKKDLHYNWKYL